MTSPKHIQVDFAKLKINIDELNNYYLYEEFCCFNETSQFKLVAFAITFAKIIVYWNSSRETMKNDLQKCIATFT